MAKKNGKFDRSAVLAGFPPTQSRMLDYLEDGQAHNATTLMRCLWDDMGARSNIGAHLTFLRQKVRAVGWDIITERHESGTYYRLIKKQPASPAIS